MRYLLFYIITIYQCYYLISKSLMLISKNAHNQGRIQGGRLGRSPPPKTYESNIFTMILYNSEKHLAASGDLTAKYY